MVYSLALIVFFAVFLRLVLTQFRWAVLLFLGLLPAYVLRFHLGPLPSTVLEGMVIILLAVWGLKLYRSPQRDERLRAIERSAFFYPGVLLLAAAALSIAWSADRVGALGIWRAYFLEPFLLYALLLDQFHDRKDWRQALVALGGTTIGLTIIAVIQRLTGWWSPTWEWSQPGQQRVTGVYTSPNALGLFVVPVISAYTWVALRVPKNRMVLVTIASGLLAILLAVSKGSWSAFITVLLVLGLGHTRTRRIVATGSLIALLIVLISPLRSPILNLATFQTDSGLSRIELYKGTLTLLKQHPLRGLGLANFDNAFESVRPTAYTEKLIYPHNILLNFWSETGLLGLAAVLWMIIIAARMALRHRNDLLHPAWPFLLALLPMLVHGLVDVPYFKNDLAMLTWFFLAGLSNNAIVKK